MINLKSEKEILNMFDKIAPKYDFLNNAISFCTHILVKKAAIKALNIKGNIKGGAKILDLCAGSGDLGRIIKDSVPDITVFGADYSVQMLDIAKKKNPDIEYFNTDATSLCFKDGMFDYVVMGFGLRNIPNKDKAVSEIYRVLKHGGKFLHLDFGQKTIFSKVFDKLVIFAAGLFTKEKDAYAYLINSKNSFPVPEELVKSFETKGFQCEKIYYLLFKIISFQILKKPPRI